MKSLLAQLRDKVSLAVNAVAGDIEIKGSILVPSQNPKFGDYQCNVSMELAGKLSKASGEKVNPRQIATAIMEKLEVAEFSEAPEIAGPGFINFKLKQEALADYARQMLRDDRLGMAKTAKPERVLVDFSGPNLAKEMHVGHLRSTIIGDSIARFMEFEGHDVLRMNHVGDWGTQFGMLIQYIRETRPGALDNPESFEIADLEDFYREAKKRFDESDDFKDAARRAVVDLQSGDKATLAVWEVFCEESLKHCHEIYGQLDIKISDRGESAYNDMLKTVVEDLKSDGKAVQTEGAWGVFLDGYKNKEDEPLPTIVQKSDGGYIYATTDLAAIRYRFAEQKTDKLIYVTDARQKTHFDQVFEISELMDWAPKDSMGHIGFGMMLGKDGKPFKTRTGGTVKLKDLLVEAESRADILARELSPGLTEEEYKEIAFAAGLGGVKYSDLSHSVGTDYKFDWDKMLATDGNTAIYILMTYARTRGLSRKAGIDVDSLVDIESLPVGSEQELKLIKKLASTPDVWQGVVSDLAPHLLLNHLYEVARDFGSFWNSCPILKIEDEELKRSRLALAGGVGRVLKWGLSMVGIKTLDKL
ncbi:arginine--tRNA ligase [Lentisphaera profundi]|uniref:Arginine--tRNA ligase n=1 Tax=Lentisphaera profundi TaxID=1658616 RepID=A0ABY7VV67_9BACT|nr:arginine--tRNA ligase [Lentisphaera profundi]WDE97786.1 arginine--tRNA ligase [Lentisphaera profundi]